MHNCYSLGWFLYIVYVYYIAIVAVAVDRVHTKTESSVWVQNYISTVQHVHSKLSKWSPILLYLFTHPFLFKTETPRYNNMRTY